MRAPPRSPHSLRLVKQLPHPPLSPPLEERKVAKHFFGGETLPMLCQAVPISVFGCRSVCTSSNKFLGLPRDFFVCALGGSGRVSGRTRFGVLAHRIRSLKGPPKNIPLLEEEGMNSWYRGTFFMYARPFPANDDEVIPGGMHTSVGAPAETKQRYKGDRFPENNCVCIVINFDRCV